MMAASRRWTFKPIVVSFVALRILTQIPLDLSVWTNISLPSLGLDLNGKVDSVTRSARSGVGLIPRWV